MMRLDRQERIAAIKNALAHEMSSKNVDTTSIRVFLKTLGERTADGVSHRLVTTNWDDLLQREINGLELEYLPHWLVDSHVYHINGTVETYLNLEFGSPFLLEEDSYKQRVRSVEADRVFSSMLWGQIFFVVGMSFECETDRFLLFSLKQHEDNLPIGESVWFVLNPDENGLDIAASRIASCLPRAKVFKLHTTFNDWVNGDNHILTQLNVFKPV